MCLLGDAPLPDDIPDAGEGACCQQAFEGGPRACTCWNPVFDRDQNPELRTDLLPMTVLPPRMCEPGPGDAGCAFRPGSPERSGDERQQCSGDGELDDLVMEGTPFYCHYGCRKVVRLVHPSGAVYEVTHGDYRPPSARNDAAAGQWVPYQADGTPARICSGWFLRWQAWLRYCEREAQEA